MNLVIEILLAVLILSASALCIYLIFVLKTLLKNAASIQKDVSNLVEKALPLLENLNDVSNRASKVVNGIENYWDEVDNSIKRVKEKVKNFTSLKSIQNDENPVKDLIKNLKAFFKGLSAFWQTFKKK